MSDDAPSDEDLRFSRDCERGAEMFASMARLAKSETARDFWIGETTRYRDLARWYSKPPSQRPIGRA